MFLQTPCSDVTYLPLSAILGVTSTLFFYNGKNLQLQCSEKTIKSHHGTDVCHFWLLQQKISKFKHLILLIFRSQHSNRKGASLQMPAESVVNILCQVVLWLHILFVFKGTHLGMGTIWVLSGTGSYP